MITVRQVERAWTARQYERLFRDLMAQRPEGMLHLDMSSQRALPAAALAIIRLDELSQSHVPLYAKLVKALISAQEADGGWGDLPITALCLRALLCGNGHGPAVERGLAFLANLQKTDGIWPKIPLRRMPADAFVSAFVLQQLGDRPEFQKAVRFSDAINWYTLNASGLDPETAALWRHASLRCRLHTPTKSREAMLIWS